MVASDVCGCYSTGVALFFDENFAQIENEENSPLCRDVESIDILTINSNMDTAIHITKKSRRGRREEELGEGEGMTEKRKINRERSSGSAG